jgi:dTDP-4-amino-4,6-dideoxygalactose transaminase
MILINDLKRHCDATADVIDTAVNRVIESGRFVLGRECADFESAFASYCGVDHCIGLGNGTDALELALRALGVRRGSRVATVANAGFYTTAVLQIIGAMPVYVDVDENSHLMNIGRLEEVLHEGDLAAIVVTHLYGRLHQMERIAGLAQRAGVPVLEDCAQAHGARRDGRRAGSFGDAAAFSFYPTKNLGALGDGGAVVTRHERVAEEVRRLRQYGWVSKYHVGMLGGRNSRLDELQAAVLQGKLPLLDGWNARRRSIAARYGVAFRRFGMPCPDRTSDDDVVHLYVIRTPRRDKLRERLQKAGVEADVHYPVPDTRQPCWGEDRKWPVLPVTERLAGEVLTLPCYPELTDQEVDKVISVVTEA